MSTPQSTPAVSPNRVRFHGPRECVLILVYPPRELQLATAAQRLSASCKLADIPPLGEDDDDESGHSTILSTTPSSVGVITPPATPRSQRQHHLIKDSSDSPTRGYSRVSTSSEYGLGGSVVPLAPISTIGSRDSYRRGHMAYYTAVKIGRGTFKMFIDTGSNTTWVKKAGYLRLLNDENHTCDAWPDGHLLRQVYSGKPPKPVSDMEMIQQSWVKEYVDKSAARIFQYPLTDDTALPYQTVLGHQVIDLERDQRQHQDLPFHYQYALAVAVNDLLEEDPTDGIIALGLSNYQATSRNNPVRVPSFLDTFGYNTVLPDPSFGEFGPAIVMYIGLRFMPFHTPQHEKPLYQSFASLNGWPCGRVPNFSEDIPDMSASLGMYEDKLGGTAFRHWDVPLVGMQIRTDDWAEEGKKRTTVRITEIPLFDPEPGQPTPRTEEQKGKSSKGGLLRRLGELKKIGKPSESESGSQLAPPQPLRVCLDTGASVSYLTLRALEAIAHHFGTSLTDTGTMCGLDIPSDRVHGNPNTDNTYVRMRFQGRESKIIEVEVPALYFLYAPHPAKPHHYEGLMFAQKEDILCRPIFGINFFHVTWVAMVKPEAEDPYVMIAPQDSRALPLREMQLLPLKDRVRVHR